MEHLLLPDAGLSAAPTRTTPSFEKPIVRENDPTAVRRLNQLTGPFILRRMKAEVLKLPPKTENIYRIELEEE